jgi:CheY-like chemotaxis protein
MVVPGVRPAPADRGKSAAPAPEPVTPPRVDSVSAPRRILAVDDSRLNLMVLKALLKGMGDFEVVSAADGQEALKILESPSERPFDLVLTDMWMPNLDGEGLAKAIRANPALASLRVIVVTADVEFREKAAELGFGAVCFEGNIGFYGKSGFVVASEKNIHYDGEPLDAVVPYFLLKELKEGYLDGVEGVFYQPMAQYADEEAADEYDKQFPPKEKKKLPGQLTH